MIFTKYIKRQDSGLKLSSANSGETSINLSTEIFDFLSGSNLARGQEREIHFKVYKEDFIAALSYIMTKLPLYKTSSNSSMKIGFDSNLLLVLHESICSFFKDDLSADYTSTLYHRTDERIYLKGLKQSSGFSIRDFLVENNSALQFVSEDNVHFDLRVISNITEEAAQEGVLREKTESLVLKESVIRQFAFQSIAYFSERSELWKKINAQVSPNTSAQEGDRITFDKEGLYSLKNIFICTTEDNINEYNTPRRRWFNEPFSLANATVFLSTEWYPTTRDNGMPYPLMIPDLARFIEDWSEGEYVCRRNEEEKTWELWHITDAIQTESVEADVVTNLEPSHVPVTFSIDAIIEYIKATGLLYTDKLVKRFAFSLLSKRFLILSGLAGSGKTQLALAFAHAMVADVEKQVCVVSVGADWTNREPLLGFPNALQPDQYVRPESGVLDLLIEANKEENQGKPFFLILDEMNMSYVERYFADFLSAMESHEKMVLWKGSPTSTDDTPHAIGLPQNLFIIGTINVDETTYMFSPKVLDRANVIEFKISSEEMSQFLTEMKEVDRKSIIGKAAGMGSNFVGLAATKELADDEAAKQCLKDFFVELKQVNAEFGYRSATEIFRFISQAKNNDDTENKLTNEEILDIAIVQKLLPKLHGSRKKLEPVLNKLWKLCFTREDRDNMSVMSSNLNHARYKESADKIYRMYKSANDNGFTSFAEA